MEIRFTEANGVNETVNDSYDAFLLYKNIPGKLRAGFLNAIAVEIENNSGQLIAVAAKETHLSAPRLKAELQRTVGQLRSFADMLLDGSWLDISIDTASGSLSTAPRQDIRKMMHPLGPVVVFGAGNFPFAYSTAGGDTASALAAGCPVIIKAHPAHAETSERVFQAIQKAMAASGMPDKLVQHIHTRNFEAAEALVKHPLIAAVGFTGSLKGGRAIYDYAATRENPIPVFAEMGSTNPVILLPEYLKENSAHLVEIFTPSITGSMGQFCTCPGVFLGLASNHLQSFSSQLAASLNKVQPEKMLYSGIVENYIKNRSIAAGAEGVELLTRNYQNAEGAPTIITVEAAGFINNEALREEVFGPFSIVVQCNDFEQLKKAWLLIKGQLTTSLFGTKSDFENHPLLIDLAVQIAGRVVFNKVPTGVQVCPSMVHGGPYPATTDSRFTAVGIQSVRRWLRPVCYQNAPQELLPTELRNENPNGIWRLVNNTWTKNSINE